MQFMRSTVAVVLGVLVVCGMVAGFRAVMTESDITARSLLSATDVLAVYVNNPACGGSAGQSCQSDPNVCGQRNSGIIQCDGSCGATQPPDSQCTDDDPPPSGGGGGGGGGALAETTPTPATTETCAERKLKGDFNCSKKVDLQDFSILAYWFKRPLTSAAITLGVDLNRDGKVTLADFSILAYYWGK